MIDTPGLGATSYRHEKILLDELSEADSVLLLVGANRPGNRLNDLSEILESTLFKDGLYPYKEQDNIYLIVNKIDEIATEEDRKRFSNSLEAISKIIGHNFYEKHCMHPNETKYFETSADFSFLAHKKQNAALSKDESERLDRYLKSHSLEESATIHEISQASGLEALTKAIATNLEYDRINQVIAKGKSCFSRCLNAAKQMIDSSLGKFNSSRTYFDLEFSEDIHRDIIENAARELVIRTIKKVQNEWFRSVIEAFHNNLEGRKKEVLHQTEERIISGAKLEIRNYLLGKFDNAKHQYSEEVSDTYIHKRIIREAKPVKILKEIEFELFTNLENKGREIAHIYNTDLRDIIERSRVLDSLSQYVNFVPRAVQYIGSFKGDLNRTLDKFESICNWSIIFITTNYCALISTTTNESDKGSEIKDLGYFRDQLSRLLSPDDQSSLNEFIESEFLPLYFEQVKKCVLNMEWVFDYILDQLSNSFTAYLEQIKEAVIFQIRQNNREVIDTVLRGQMPEIQKTVKAMELNSWLKASQVF